LKSVWLTYAWDDNRQKDVDFAAQELTDVGLDVKLDRWNLDAGKRLWEQVDSFIGDPTKSDAWLFYATQASLGSEKCKEEYWYALDRALETRGGEFPIIALFPSPVDEELIPAGVKTRLFVSTTDPDWKERIVAAVEQRSANIARPRIEPYLLTTHPGRGEGLIIEVRPRAGTWAPFFVATPLAEKDQVNPSLHRGPAGRPPTGPVVSTVLFGVMNFESPDGKWWVTSSDSEATPSQSYFITCERAPSEMHFGVLNGEPQFAVAFN
jgi:hypothetical protein